MTYTVGAAQIFTLFFIMLGPIKMIVPFARATQHLERKAADVLAYRSAIIGAAIAIVGGFAGSALLGNWGIDPLVLAMAGGIIFFVTAMKIVLPHAPEPAVPAVAEVPGVMQVIFPMILTPYGLAALIVFLAGSADPARTTTIVALLLANIALDLLCMLFVRPILRVVTPTGMQVIFALLGVLMVALALQMILMSAHQLGLVPMA